MNRLVQALLIFVFMFSTGCSLARVKLDDKWNPKSKPTYEDYFDQYWWGFSGTAEVSLQKVCIDQKPYAFRKLKSFEDIILTVITFGVYTPVTVRVWCGD